MKSPWPTKKLGEICEERKEKNINNENLPVFTVSHIYGLIPYQNIFYKQVHSKDTKNYKIVNRYDFAFGLPTKDTLPYGLLENEDKVLVSPAYVVFSIKNKNLLFPRFLYYLLKTNYYKWKIIEMAKSQSATRHGLPLKFHHLANLEIPLPPLHIQQKIVKILDTVQSAVDIQEKIIEKTKELKKSLMAELFKYGAPSFRKGRKLKKTEIGEIPENWEIVKLGDEKKGEPLILTLRNGLTYKQHELQESGLPITRIETIADGKIDFEKVGYLKNIDQNLLEEYKLKKGDILFSHINSEIHLGKTAIYLEDKFILHGMNLLLIRSNSKFIDSKFLNYLFNWYKDNGIFISIASRAVNQASINQNTLKNLKIPLPPLPEQQEIAEILQTIDRKIEIEKKKKELYEELFKTMLNKIMNQEIDINLLDY